MTQSLRDHTVKITLWGDLAHSLSEDVVGKHTVIIVTSTMVEGLQGKFWKLKTPCRSIQIYVIKHINNH